MNAPTPVPPHAPPRPRSGWVTAVAWAVIAAGGLSTPISFLALLMSVAHHYGSSGTVSGFLTVVVAPPVTLVAGICLLRRQRWARYYLIILSAIVIGWNLLHIARGPQPERVTISPSGVKTTILATSVHYYVPWVVISTALLVVLFLPPVRSDFAPLHTPPPLPRE